jgi:hypothetical protein
MFFGGMKALIVVQLGDICLMKIPEWWLLVSYFPRHGLFLEQIYFSQ